MDGFRFDLMGMLDVPLMNRIQEELDKRFGKGEKLLYGEPWAGGECQPRGGTELAHKGNMKRLDPAIGAFCDNIRDAVKGSVTIRITATHSIHNVFRMNPCSPFLGCLQYTRRKKRKLSKTEWIYAYQKRGTRRYLFPFSQWKVRALHA